MYRVLMLNFRFESYIEVTKVEYYFDYTKK